ncbi:leucine dehydrogenase [Sphingomonas sp. UYAg733]
MSLVTVEARPPEETVYLDDPQSGLRGVIVINSSQLGPAAGGCRLRRYSSEADNLTDALRLAEGMSYKNALANLPLGGGKAALVLPANEFDRVALFRAFGRAVAKLDGRYVTAEDVGTTVEDMLSVAQETRHVAGLPAPAGAPGGDPAPWTALGVFRSMEVAVNRRLGAPVSDVTVAVQGLGNVGFALCRLLHEAGARLIVAEPRSAIAAKAATLFNAEIMSSAALVKAKVDVFSPCALGAVLDAATIAQLQAKVVCGAANNQLATPADGLALAMRGIMYAPDYVVNAGGIINVAAEYLGWTESEAAARVSRVAGRLVEVLDLADTDGCTTSEAADALARAVIAGGRHA